jgi:hypothetical protein
MLFVTRTAFGISFGLLALGATALVAFALQHRKSPKRVMHQSIDSLTVFKRKNHIKRPPFLPQPGGSFKNQFLRD